jgi:hypothetical protein
MPPAEAPPRDDETPGHEPASRPASARRARRPAAPAATAPVDDVPTLEDERRSPWRRVSQGVIAVMLIGIVVMWLYAFFGDVPSPARLEDRTFPVAAEPICARARAELDALPRAFETPDHRDRADVVDRATSRLDAMVGELRATVPPAQPTRDRLNAWLDDWDIYLRDRRDYTARLRADPGARFYLTQSERDRSQINRSLDNFAHVNTMASCATPEDVV